MKTALITVHVQNQRRKFQRLGYLSGNIGVLRFTRNRPGPKFVWRAYRQPDGARLSYPTFSREDALLQAKRSLRAINKLVPAKSS